MDSISTENFFTFEQDNFLIKSMPILQEFRKNGLFCDVVLKAGDREFSAHRNILAATIPYFYTMFTSEYMESKQKEIIIQNIDPSVLEALINFSYSGKIQVDPLNVQKLMTAADFVQLTKVKNACADYLESTIQADNVFETKKLANLLNCQQLESAADEFINENFSEIGGTKEFLMLSFGELKEIIGKDCIICTEDKVFEAAMKWLKHKEAERISHLPEILSKVQLSLISTEYLVNVVSTEELIMSSFECIRIIDKAKSDRLMQCGNNFLQRSRNSSKYSDFLARISKNQQLKIYDVMQNECLKVEHLGRLENRPGSAIVPLGRKFYIIGGNGSNVDIYDLETKKWSEGENMINERSYFGATSLNNCIYVCGGSQDSNYLSSVECYSAREKSWKSVAPMLTVRSNAGVTTLNGYIYAFGGFNKDQLELSSCEKYDPKSNTWTYIEPLVGKRYGAGVAILNNKIYVCGGYNENHFLNSCEVYDPSTDTWSIVPPMNWERYLFSLSSINGKLYAVGGHSLSCNRSSVEIYSPETNSWKTLNNIHL